MVRNGFNRTSRRAAIAAGMVFASVALSGCESALLTPATALMASGAVIINTDRTPGDHLASYMTGLDCDTIRASRDGGPQCRPPNEEIIDPPVYCYRTLGKIDCFRSPDPYGYDQREVN
ncbi:MAG: hypothetical protein RIM33_13760 [Alphaproteobacteria bacterium]